MKIEEVAEECTLAEALGFSRLLLAFARQAKYYRNFPYMLEYFLASLDAELQIDNFICEN